MSAQEVSLKGERHNTAHGESCKAMNEQIPRGEYCCRRRMEHGGVEHGVQHLNPARQMIPVFYYGRSSGIGVAIRRQPEIDSDRALSVGVVGLGAGAIAAYGET